MSKARPSVLHRDIKKYMKLKVVYDDSYLVDNQMVSVISSYFCVGAAFSRFVFGIFGLKIFGNQRICLQT